MANVKRHLRRRRRALRVTQSAETISAATRLAIELAESGTSRDDVLLQVSELVGSREVAEAILEYVDTRGRLSPSHGNLEKLSGIYFGALGLLVIWICFLCARWLYGWVLYAPNDALAAAAAACGQAIVVRLAWRILKACGISLTDSLNAATYPTVLHRPQVTTASEDAVRHERLRLLIADMVLRMARGERFSKLYRELSRIELTRVAAVWVLIQAKLGLLIKLNFPPYSSRSRAYMVAAGAAVGCIVGIALVQHRLRSSSQMDYLITWSVLIVMEFLRTPRRVHATEAA